MADDEYTASREKVTHGLYELINGGIDTDGIASIIQQAFEDSGIDAVVEIMTP